MTYLLTLWDAGSLTPAASPALPTSFGVAILCAYGFNFLKKVKAIPQVTYYTTKLNAAIRAIITFVSSIGISIAWNGADHTLILGNLTWTVIGVGLYHWAVQFGLQSWWENILQQAQIAQYRSQKEGIDPHITVKSD